MEITENIYNPVERLFWEKYRPNSFEDVVLLPRIKNVLQYGIKTNLILSGPHGIGKTTLARILVKKHPHIVLSSKLGVDKLRNEVQEFCSKMSVGFDDEINTNIKVVCLEEFDGATRQMQDELRAFIEEYEQHVRFIATCNHIQKIQDPILSRFNVIDFNPSGSAESKHLKTLFLKYLLDLNEKEQLNISRDALKKCMVKNFPDFRKTLQDIQIINLTGDTNVDVVNNDDNTIYEYVFSKVSPTDMWNYLYKNWLDRFDLAFEKFNRDFWHYTEEHHPDKLIKLPNYFIVISKYIDTHLPNARDPFVTLYAMLWEMNQM